MKVYLASKFALKNKVNDLSEYLATHGFTTTCKWWYDDIKQLSLKSKNSANDIWYKLPEVITVSERDYKGVDDADAVILVSDSSPMSFNGANIEIGYAIAKSKKIFILGAVDRCALYTRATFCKNSYDLLIELKNLRTAREEDDDLCFDTLSLPENA